MKMSFVRCIALVAMVGILASCGGTKSDTQSRETSVETGTDLAWTGLAFLGARSASYDCQDLIDMFDGIRRPALSVLWPSFGDRNDCIADWLRRYVGQPKVFNAYLYNGPCRRRIPEACEGKDDGSIEEIVLNSAYEATAVFELFHTRGDQLILTLGLEDDLSNEQACDLAQKLRGIYPDAIISRNKNGGISRVELDCFGLYEIHGDDSTVSTAINYAYSNDGQDLEFAGYWRLPHRISSADLFSRVAGGRYADALYIYIWDAEFNGLSGDLAESDPPAYRDLSFDREFVNSVNQLLKDIQDERTID